MAGYIPESTKEIQALIAKSYADTVLNAFLLAPELLTTAPVGGRADYEGQLEMLAEREKETMQDRHNFISLCYVASVEGELMLRYARDRKFDEGDVRWLEDEVASYEAGLSISPSQLGSHILKGLNELLEDVRSNRFVSRSKIKENELSQGYFTFGGYKWEFHGKSPLKSYFSFLYSVPRSFDPGDVAELQRRKYEISQLADVAKYGYDILKKLCEKARDLDVQTVFVNTLLSPAFKKRAERTYEEGKTPKLMQKPIVLSGPPGVGKTAMLREIANWTNTHLFSFSMAQMDAASFGFPVYDSVTGSAKRDILDDMKNTVKSPGIVLLDEMNRTGTDIQSKLLTYLLDHKVSGFTVHPLSLVVGAENPVSADPYGTMTKSIAMIDRCMYIDVSNYDMIVNGWFEWLEETYGDVAEEIPLLRYFMKFLKEEPPLGARDIILKIPEDPEENPGFPTPRSIDAVIAAVILSHGDYETALTEMTANVGSEMANRFAGYMDMIKALPKPEELARKADEIYSLFAAIAIDSDIALKPGGAQVVGFEKGLFNTINGYDDGTRNQANTVLEKYTGKDEEFRKILAELNPDTASRYIEEKVRELYFSRGQNFFEIGAEAEMADILLSAFQKSFRDSIENDRPIDGIYLTNLFKAACFFPVPVTRNNLLNMMERTILLIPWLDDYSEINDYLNKLCHAEVKTRKGTVKLDETSPVHAFFKILSASPWLTKVSKRFEDTFKEVTELLKQMERENDDEVRVG